MGISLKRPGNPADWFRLWKLYMSAFPVSERKLFAMTFEAYQDLFRNHYSPWVADHVVKP